MPLSAIILGMPPSMVTAPVIVSSMAVMPAGVVIMLLAPEEEIAHSVAVVNGRTAVDLCTGSSVVLLLILRI